MTAISSGLDKYVLVLNRQFKPISVTHARRAFHLLITGAARALDADMQAFDFHSWAELSAELHDDVVRTPSRLLRVPRVVLLQFYDRMPDRHVRFSRQNIYLRDHFTCQYCGHQKPRDLLNLDHVVPRCGGGRTTWENVVCCCIACNLRKGSKSPEQAGMQLLRRPFRPIWWSSFSEEFGKKNEGRVPYKEWLPFLDVASASYWNTELIDD